jgi:16S rRNA (guanine966-N2)-methyltransferase
MVNRRKDTRRSAQPVSGEDPAAASPPRIIGGTLRGRKLLYAAPDPRTRPMKDRTREAVFNLLGYDVQGRHAVDLFAGTGALAIEAISRGAPLATIIEQHFPTANTIRRNVTELGVADRIEVLAASAFVWADQPTADASLPWLVFCSPPYAFFRDRQDQMLALIRNVMARAPADSVFVVESDKLFDPRLLPRPDDWDIREYPPAVVAIYRAAETSSSAEVPPVASS